MKTCSEECRPICDFCRFFNYNGYGEAHGFENAIYVGNGYCVFYEHPVDPEDGYECQDFICTNYKVEHKPREIK